VTGRYTVDKTRAEMTVRSPSPSGVTMLYALCQFVLEVPVDKAISEETVLPHLNCERTVCSK
jgi:hypothetical protein